MKKFILMVTLLCSICATAIAADVKGVILDKQTNQPIEGVTVLAGTLMVLSDVEGKFTIAVTPNDKKLLFSHISYQLQEADVVAGSKDPITVFMESAVEVLDDIKVVSYKNNEVEEVLLTERKASLTALENIGAKEMSQKGISNAEDGVKKMTGVSVAGAGQIIVRGLGDRYSITTLNGLSIASPNPDNKLAPLDIFPSAAVKNITVSKVYDAKSYADYSGAHIDISTKNYAGEKLFTVGLGVGGNFNTIGKDFYAMDNVSMFSQSSIPSAVNSMPKSEFNEYILQNNIFQTDFSVKKKTSLPTLDGNIAYSNSFDIGRQKLNILAAAGISNKEEAKLNSLYQVVEAGGAVSDSYTYDKYESQLNMSGMANIGLTMRDLDKITYTLFYARNAEETYELRDGHTDNQGHVVTSNNITHIYKMLINQLQGDHYFGQKFNLDWNAAYTTTASDEPDRRQVMFTDNSQNNGYMLYTNDQQSTMRYFGYLEETQFDADLALNYKLGKSNKLSLGGAYKNKQREYGATRFYYGNLYSIQNQVDGYDVYNTNGYLNYNNIQDGTITVDRVMQPNDTYTAKNVIYSGFATADLVFKEKATLNLGLRYEYSDQQVDYYSTKYDTRTYKKGDLFPAVNFKYNLSKISQLRFAFSRTVTRPSFVEMAPFLYQESYGSAQIIGNANLVNGYNYNVDLRYEMFLEGGDMVSVTGYFKQLQDPIERVQEKQGGSTLHTFKNAEDGIATGVELEIRKRISPSFNASANGSYMFTDIKLSEGAYTNKERQLQGASPYLVNADIVYTPKLANSKDLSFALLYNLQGPRIYAVGLNGQGDVTQRPFNLLNFVAQYAIGKKISLKLELDNLLNIDEVYEQEVIATGKKVVVEQFNTGIFGKIGITFKL